MESVEDVLQALRGWQQVPARQDSQRSGQTHPLLAHLHAAPMSSEALAGAAGLALSGILAELTELEIEGLVACENGVWVACQG